MGRNSVLDCSMFDPVTIDWIGRVNANSGTVNRTTRKAVDKLVQSAKLNGWWTKCKRLNLFAGDQLAAAMVPLLVGGGNAIETNTGPFVGGDYTLAGGLVGNTTTKYLKSGWIPSTELTTSLDAHLGAIILAAGSNAATRSYMGVSSGSFAQRFYLQWVSAGTTETTYLGANTNGSISYAAAGGPDTGHIVRVNTDSTHGVLYRDAVSKAVNSSLTNIRATEEVYVGCTNSGGASPANYGGHTWGGYHLGIGLTATDLTNMYNAINTFCTAVGRTLP